MNSSRVDKYALDKAANFAKQGAWEEAYQAYALADHGASLDAGHLDAFATAAYMSGREPEYAAILERAFQAYSNEGLPKQAARAAFWNGLTSIFRGEHGRGSGWLARSAGIVQGLSPDCAERGYILLPQVEGAFAAGDLAKADRIASQAMQIGERCGDADLTELARHLVGRARIAAGAMRDGITMLDQTMLAATQRQLSPIVTGLLYCSVIEAYQRFVVLDRAREWTHALTDWCGEQPELVAFTGRCLVHRSEILLFDGKWPEAAIEASAACLKFGADTQSRHAGTAHYQKGEVLRLSGRFDEADASYRAASALGVNPQPGLALMSLSQGQMASAWAGIRRGLAGVTAAPARMRLLPAAVEIALAAGEIDQAEALCAEMDELIAAFGSDASIASAAEAWGDLHLARGMIDTALQDYEKAAALWQQLEAPYQLARARLKKGRVCNVLGDEFGARSDAEAARDGFRALGAEPDRRAAEAVLRQLDPKEPALLTPRQTEVLRYVVRGLTNREIAAQLDLSERTVDRHVSDILVRIDAPTRAAASAFAVGHGLISPKEIG